MEGIRTENLTMTYDGCTPVVDHLNLEVAPGEILALLGENGAGKTTLLKLLAGLEDPAEGEIRIGDRSIRQEETRKALGISPQEVALADNLSVKDNLKYMAGVKGLGRREAREQVRRLLQALGLEPYARKRAGDLSGGWKRRLSMGLALMGNPGVLLLDEPTAGLDIRARGELWGLIQQLRGLVTVVVTTYDPGEAEALADRIGIMDRGRLLAIGTAAALRQETGMNSLREAYEVLLSR